MTELSLLLIPITRKSEEIQKLRLLLINIVLIMNFACCVIYILTVQYNQKYGLEYCHKEQ